MRGALVTIAVLALVCAGCGTQPAPPGPPPPAPAQVAPPPPPPAGADQAPPTIREKAAVGMGEKGRGYGTGPVATPIRALWATREKVVLIQIQKSMDVYKALDPNGRGPKTHEEFMEKIIRANDIKLPELPSGHRYVYDPVQGELLVEQPRD